MCTQVLLSSQQVAMGSRAMLVAFTRTIPASLSDAEQNSIFVSGTQTAGQVIRRQAVGVSVVGLTKAYAGAMPACDRLMVNCRARSHTITTCYAICLTTDTLFCHKG